MDCSLVLIKTALTLFAFSSNCALARNPHSLSSQSSHASADRLFAHHSTNRSQSALHEIGRLSTFFLGNIFGLFLHFKFNSYILKTPNLLCHSLSLCKPFPFFTTPPCIRWPTLHPCTVPLLFSCHTLSSLPTRYIASDSHCQCTNSFQIPIAVAPPKPYGLQTTSS